MSAASQSDGPAFSFGDWNTICIAALYRALNNFRPTPQTIPRRTPNCRTPTATRNGERVTCHLLGPEQGILMPALAAVLGAVFDLLARWS